MSLKDSLKTSKELLADSGNGQGALQELISAAHRRTKVASEETKKIYLALCRPFDMDKLHWRLGATNAKANNGVPSKGVPLAYIDARDVMYRLDGIVGPFGWQTDMSEIAGTCAVTLKLLIDGEWIERTDTAGQTDVEGEKGAASTALRRAAAQFGIGRYLYRLPNTWVDLKETGTHYAGYWGGQRKYFDSPALPKFADPVAFDAHYKTENKDDG